MLTPCLFWDRIWIRLRIRGRLVKEFFKTSKNWQSYRGEKISSLWIVTTIAGRGHTAVQPVPLEVACRSTRTRIQIFMIKIKPVRQLPTLIHCIRILNLVYPDTAVASRYDTAVHKLYSCTCSRMCTHSYILVCFTDREHKNFGDDKKRFRSYYFLGSYIRARYTCTDRKFE